MIVLIPGYICPAVKSHRILREHTPTQVRSIGTRTFPVPLSEVGPNGMAVRHLKWYASWVQNGVRQFGPYLPWALDD